jgi:hypothetical protein
MDSHQEADAILTFREADALMKRCLFEHITRAASRFQFQNYDRKCL